MRGRQGKSNQASISPHAIRPLGHLHTRLRHACVCYEYVKQDAATHRRIIFNEPQVHGITLAAQGNSAKGT